MGRPKKIVNTLTKPKSEDFTDYGDFVKAKKEFEEQEKLNRLRQWEY